MTIDPRDLARMQADAAAQQNLGCIGCLLLPVLLFLLVAVSAILGGGR